MGAKWCRGHLVPIHCYPQNMLALFFIGLIWCLDSKTASENGETYRLYWLYARQSENCLPYKRTVAM